MPTFKTLWDKWQFNAFPATRIDVRDLDPGDWYILNGELKVYGDEDLDSLSVMVINTNYKEDYWIKRMDQRMPIDDEVSRLKEMFEDDEERPWGNKNIAASIAYKLGWDIERRLCFRKMPESIVNETWELYKLAIPDEYYWEWI